MAEQTLSIIGLGLIGGSIGLAVKKHLSNCQIIGYDQNNGALDGASARGAIHTAAKSLTQAISGVDLLIVATPVGALRPLFQQIAEHGKPGLVLTDVASTKRTIVALAEQTLPPRVGFVGSHPIAGSEKGGIASARADLLNNALCVLTPTSTTALATLRRVTDFWQSLGLRTTEMSPPEHDHAYAAVSHLPHAVAAALMNGTPETLMAFAGKGFSDTTRIAAGNPTLWRDILTDNADNVRDGLLKLSDDLRSLADLLSPDRSAELLAYLTRAAEARRRLADRSAGPST